MKIISKFILAMFLIMIILCNFLNIYSLANQEVTIQYKEDCGSLIKRNGIAIKVSYAVFNNNGIESPVYCLNKEKPGVGEVGNYNVNIKQKYIQNINYIKHILGNVNNIALATDDMSYYKIDSEYYKNMNVFKQTEADKEITELLKINNYTEVEIEQIKNKNFEKFFNIK